MEGSYSKVWHARQQVPAEEYKYFIDSLMGTIRNEIATCEESAYASLPLKDAATLLFFPTQGDLLTFAKQVCGVRSYSGVCVLTMPCLAGLEC